MGGCLGRRLYLEFINTGITGLRPTPCWWVLSQIPLLGKRSLGSRHEVRQRSHRLLETFPGRVLHALSHQFPEVTSQRKKHRMDQMQGPAWVGPMVASGRAWWEPKTVTLTGRHRPAGACLETWWFLQSSEELSVRRDRVMCS